MLNSLGQNWCFAYADKAVFMQRIADAVQRGHTRYYTGSIARHKAVDLYNDLSKSLPIFESAQIYEGANTNAQRAYRARQEGSATGRILFWLPHTKSDHLHFIVLMTGVGEIPEVPGIKWLDPKKTDIQVANYRMVRVDKSKVFLSPKLPPKKPPAKGVKRRDTHTYTWKINDAEYQDLRNRLTTAMKSGRFDDARDLLDVVFRVLGFSAARAQAKKLIALTKSQWEKSSAGPLPEMPIGPGYIQKISDHKKWCRIFKDGSIQRPGEARHEYTIPPKGVHKTENPKAERQDPTTRVIMSIPEIIRTDPSIDLGRWQSDKEYREQIKKDIKDTMSAPVKKEKIEVKKDAGEDFHFRAQLENSHGQIRLPGT